MSNVLSNEQRQQILALGRLGWTLRRIEQATGSRRETVSAYLKAAGLAVGAAGCVVYRFGSPGEADTNAAQLEAVNAHGARVLFGAAGKRPSVAASDFAAGRAGAHAPGAARGGGAGRRGGRGARHAGIHGARVCGPGAGGVMAGPGRGRDPRGPAVAPGAAT